MIAAVELMLERAEVCVSAVWHGVCNVDCVPNRGATQTSRKGFSMSKMFNNATAAVFAFAVTAFVMATAIVPATPSLAIA